MATPNMNLTLPTVGVTAGPTYAQQNNAALEAIDEHDHTSGNGVQVPSAGININADLDFNGYSPTGLESAVFDDVVGTPAVRSVYVDDGELYFKDASGNAVQLTANGSISGTPGSISNLGDGGSSAVFSDLAEDFSWYFSGTKLAAMNMGDLRLFPFDGSATYSNFITLKASTALASNFSLTLPTALPANTNFVQVSSAGALSFSNTITQPILAADGTAGAPAYSFSNDTNTGVYRSSADNLTLAAAGTNALTVSGSAVTAHLPLYANTGSVSAPTIAFSSDTNTGFWLQTTDTIGVTAGGVQRLSIGSTISTNNTNLNVGSGTVTAATGTFTTLGAAAATSINLSGGGAFKATLFTGTGSGSSVNLAPAGATIIYGVCGYAQIGGGSTYAAIDISGAGVTDVYFEIVTGTAASVRLFPSTRAYRVIVFHN